MDERTRRLLNSSETIKAFLPLITEGFVQFYGEEERENIEEKFKNLLIFGYCRPEKVKLIINERISKIEYYLKQQFLEKYRKNSRNISKFSKVIFDSKSLKYPDLHNINSYIQYKNGNNSYKKRAVEFLNNFYPQITIENADDYIFNNELSFINKLVDDYQKLLSEFEEKCETLKPYMEYAIKCGKLEDSLKVKYLKLIYDEIKHIFNRKMRKEIEKVLSEKKGYYDILNSHVLLEIIFGEDFGSDSLITSFSEENDEILKINDSSDWRIESIKDDRICYFNKLGFDLGDNYDDYINDPVVIANIPKKKDITKIENIRREFYKKMMTEYYTSTEEYKTICQKVALENFSYYDITRIAISYEDEITCVIPFIKEVNNKRVLYPVLCISMETPLEYLDHTLIHELNHVYEGEYNMDTNYYSFGWVSSNDSDFCVCRIFNEIINELISQEISEILNSLGIYIFNTKENTKIKGSSFYESTLFLVQEFYDLYKKEIIASRKNKNMEVLFDKVGRKNFEELNNLFQIFSEYFNVDNIGELQDDLVNNRNTEKTKIYNKLLDLKDKIMEKMSLYDKKQEFKLYDKEQIVFIKKLKN